MDKTLLIKELLDKGGKDYAAEPLDEGYTKILKYGVCFCKKNCKVKREAE